MLIPLLSLLSSIFLAMSAAIVAVRCDGAMVGMLLKMLFPCEGMRKCEEGKVGGRGS